MERSPSCFLLRGSAGAECRVRPGLSLEVQAAQSFLVGRTPPWGNGWPKGCKTLCGRLPSPEDIPETSAPFPANKYFLPYCFELASSGRDGSLGRNPLSQPNFPTYWLCNLRLTIVFCLGFTFLIRSIRPVRDTKAISRTV